MQQEPTIGRTVLYRVKSEDLERLAGFSGGTSHHLPGQTLPNARLFSADGKVDRLEWAGNVIRPGDTFPLHVTRPWHQPGQYVPGTSCLNGTVLLDGPGVLWALSVVEGEGPGTWSWPKR